MNLNRYLEQVADTLAWTQERRDAITKKAVEEERTLSVDEAQEFDQLTADIQTLTEDHKRFSELEATEMAHATAAPRGPAIIIDREKDEAFEGQNFTRQIIAKAWGMQTQRSPVAVAQERWGRENPRLVNVIKADVLGGGSGSGEWGNELVSQDTWLGDFQNFLYGQTVYNQLPLREVPANITIKGQDGAASAYWVGESKAIPATSADFNDVTLTPLKVASLAVVSNELMRDSSPSAEMLVRDALVEAIRQRIDTTFISTAAATAAAPAGILNNIAATSSSGTDGDAFANDAKELMYRFVAAKNSGGLSFVMNPSLAMAISLLRNALDQYEFPEVSTTGGTIYQMPVIVGDNVPENALIMLKPSDIYRIGAGEMQVSISQQATIEMDDAPAGDTDTPTAPTGKFVGMFQTESTAIKVVQSMNFARRRESAVAWINDADYGGAIST
ncbi:phage major capsid protein [Pseudohaliea sp.]|uniref:phage major capsid protein n=1 Tax=Pseudohaliea sp. TaxID=2740289 RepID=UPI0032EAEE20